MLMCVLNYRYLIYCLQNTKARLRVKEEEYKALQWEHEVLEQRFEKVLAVIKSSSTKILSQFVVLCTRRATINSTQDPEWVTLLVIYWFSDYSGTDEIGLLSLSKYFIICLLSKY